MNIKLNWTKLQPVSNFHISEVYGVYIWGFLFEEEFVPYYVGIAFKHTISNRIFQHVNDILGGKYCIIHSKDLREFYKFNKDMVSNDERGLIYIPKWPNEYSTFLKKRKELSPHIDNMIDKMHFTYSILGKEFQTKNDYEIVEKACINAIGIEKLWNKRGGSVDVKIIEVDGDTRVTKLFNKFFI